MGRRARIKELNQVDGKDHIQEFRRQSVDEVFGFEKSKFPTSSAKEYESILKNMNKFDLNEEATKLGLFPTDDRYVMIERLLNEFAKNEGAANGARAIKPQLKISKQGRDLLAEGA